MIEKLDKYKWWATSVLVIVTALTYAVTDTIVRVTAVMYPSTKLVVINRTTEKRNVVVQREVIVRTNGERIERETTRDTSVVAHNETNQSESVAVVPQAHRFTLWTGGGADLALTGARTYHASVGVSVGPLLAVVENPVWEARLNPRVSVAYGWRF